MTILNRALRSLLRTPGFSLVAVLALALGIGSNTAIFSIVNAIFLRALPYADPTTLVQLNSSIPEQQLIDAGFSWVRLQAVEKQQTVFSRMAVAVQTGFTVTGEGDPEQVAGMQVSQSFFPLLGIPPQLGREFTVDEDRPGAEPVAIISHAFWQRRFGGRRDVIGQPVLLDGRPYTVIGVMPASLSSFPMAPVAVWTPRPSEVPFLVPAQIDNGGLFFTVLARLKPGVSIGQARQAVSTIAASYAKEFPAHVDAKASADVNFLLDGLVGNQRPTYAILFAAVGCLLLIACANVANLVLARYAGRKKQIAIRFVLGAKRRHVVVEFVAENILLALAGGLLGLLLARWALLLVASLGADFIPRADEISLDGTALAFALALSVATGTVLGLLPAQQLARPVLAEAMNDSTRGSSGSLRQRRTRSALLVGEVAISFVLLIAAGLLTASFLRMQRVAPGFDPNGIFTAAVQPPPNQYPDGTPALSNFYLRLSQRLASIPGVHAVALSDSPPLSGNNGPAPYAVVGRAIPALGDQPSALRHIISPDFFTVIGVRITQGRDFNQHDVPGSPPVIIINEAMARQAFPNQNPIGQKLVTGMAQRTAEVVGVVADTRTINLATPPGAEMYHPILQRPENFTNILLRTSGDPLLLDNAARAALKEIDPGLPLTNPTTVLRWVEQSTADRRLTMSLIGVFAALALLLASLGIYSVIAYSVGQRSVEIGVRMAMGAQPAEVQRMVVRQGLVLTGIGVALGIFAALLLTRLMQALLFETAATDPFTYLGISALLALVAVCACWLPARRAARIQPLVAMRNA